MTLFRPIPRSVTRPLSLAVLLVWAGCMAVLVHRAYVQAAPANLATDLARYGPTATWRGVYYRGEKIGFTVSQTIRTDEGFELQEDARFVTLLGSSSITTIRTSAFVDSAFALRAFAFALDPGSGAVEVRGAIEPAGGEYRLRLAITAGGATRTEERRLEQPPATSLNVFRMLASRGLAAGARYEWSIFDPATLRNAPMAVSVGEREIVRTRDGSMPAFRVEMAYLGLTTTSWVTDTGEVIREESPLGLMTMRETPEQAQGLAVPGNVQQDLLRMSAVVPVMSQRIDDPRAVLRLRLRLEGLDLPALALDGGGQTAEGPVVELRDTRTLEPGPADPDLARYLAPEPLIESDAPEIVAETERALQGVVGARARAERLTRYVDSLIDKKLTMSLPSALEVLRTKVGDCNEHTALYVAMARAAGIPARIAVGLVYVSAAQGAFYYHAWPEVYLDEGDGRGLWLPVDPTLNQFPADATHLRLVRGGLDQQAAIVPLIGRLRITVLALEVDPRATPVLVGGPPAELPALAPPLVQRPSACGCDTQPAPERAGAPVLRP